jgi:hypothetical protein
MCEHTLGPLVCTSAGHPYGHTYESTSGVEHAEKEEL